MLNATRAHTHTHPVHTHIPAYALRHLVRTPRGNSGSMSVSRREGEASVVSKVAG